jgi:glyoxylase-like metal-dependent hydrolase (beta-lactamase superfamily II)
VDATSVRVYAIVPGLWQLRLPTAWDGLPSTNAFVIERSDGGIDLVDCGGSGDESAYAALIAGIEATGWSLADVRQLIFTHYHSDHAGPAARIVRETGCSVAGHPAAGHAFDAWERPEEVEQMRAKLARRDGVPEELIPAFATIEEELHGFDGQVTPDVRLTAGTYIDSSLGRWDVLETPGHAPSHICLLQRERRLLLAGDLIAAVFVPYFDIGYTDDPAGEYIASLRAIRDLPISAALPGHGRRIEDVIGVIDMHLASMAQRLDACRQELERNGPGTVYDVVRRMHPETIDAIALVWRWCETTAYLNHLAQLCVVERTHNESNGALSYTAGSALSAS